MPFTVYIHPEECFDDDKQEFFYTPCYKFEIEHSLHSLWKWEAKHKKPFLTTTMDNQMFIDYVRCMTLTPKVPEEAYLSLKPDNLAEIQAYMEEPMTATTVKNKNNKPSRKIVTAELIYHWMIEMDIPFECQYWHLNRLMMLITVRMEKSGGQKKMSKKDILSSNASLNAARKAKLGTRG